MDRQYLLEHPNQLPMFIEHQRIRSTPVIGGDTSVPQRLTLDDGTDLFAKFSEQGPPGLLEAEARGLEWLSQAPVPRLLCHTDEVLVCEWIEPGKPTAAAAAELGGELARAHLRGAERFGAPWRGYIGAAPMDNDADEHDWPSWFAARRLEPYLRMARDSGALDEADGDTIARVISTLDRIAGPTEPIARLHGDLWPGNIHWGRDRAWLIDPAAHGGHRETDLANLRLFGGTPYLDTLLESYQEIWPLAEGWQERIPLHQLFLLLVHAALFGRAYRSPVLATANAYL